METNSLHAAEAVRTTPQLIAQLDLLSAAVTRSSRQDGGASLWTWSRNLNLNLKALHMPRKEVHSNSKLDRTGLSMLACSSTHHAALRCSGPR